MLYSQITWLCIPVFNYYCPVHLICRSPGNQQHYNGGIYIIFSHSVVNILLDISMYTYYSLSYNRSIASSKVNIFTECNLVLPLLTPSILLFPSHHPVAAYIFFLVFSSLLSFPLSFLRCVVEGRSNAGCDQLI